MKQIPLILAALALSTPAYGHSIENIKFDGAELFLAQKEQLTEYSLPTAKILLQEEDTDARTSGYHPAAQLPLKGRVTRKILDFPRSYSPYQIRQQIEHQLAAHQYEISFTCRGKLCGELSGWQELVTPYIDGDENNQQVIVARKIFPNLDANYVLVHINDIDSEPRMLLDVIETSPSDTFKHNKKQPISIGLFDTNSVNLPQADLKLLDKIATLIKSEPEHKFTLKGHSDSLGTETDNQKLSLKRAKSVLDYLVNQHSLAPDRFEIEGLGETDSIAKNDKVSSRRLNRRVEVSLFISEKHELTQRQVNATAVTLDNAAPSVL